MQSQILRIRQGCSKVMGNLGIGAIESYNPKQIAKWKLKETQNSVGRMSTGGTM